MLFIWSFPFILLILHLYLHRSAITHITTLTSFLILFHYSKTVLSLLPNHFVPPGVKPTPWKKREINSKQTYRCCAQNWKRNLLWILDLKSIFLIRPKVQHPRLQVEPACRVMYQPRRERKRRRLCWWVLHFNLLYRRHHTVPLCRFLLAIY